MDPNKNKNSGRGGRNDRNWQGIGRLVLWALVLALIFSVGGTYMRQSMNQSQQVEINYSEFMDLVEEGNVTSVELDASNGLLLVTPKEGFTYTDEEGTVHKGEYQLYTTQLVSNDVLIPYLTEHGVECEEPYTPPISPVVAFLVTYILPFAPIMLMFSLVMSYHYTDFAQQNPFIYFSTTEQDYVFQVFAAFYTDLSFGYNFANMTQEQTQQVIAEAKAKSRQNYNVSVTSEDKIITLSTCTRMYGNTNNQRFVVMAKLVPAGTPSTTISTHTNAVAYNDKVGRE